MSTPLIPQQTGNTFSLTMGDTVLECTTSNSGRITTFAKAGKNMLTDAATNPFNFGSTFWTAPQSDWNWPPPAAMDSDGPWDGVVEEDTIVLTSPPCDKQNVQITKRIRGDVDKAAIVISYVVKNLGDTAKSLAPWEISRTAPGGLTFFPQGPGTYPQPEWQKPLPIQNIGGVTWFSHTDETITDQHKLFADGKEGWIAHVDGDLLFLKSFDAIPPEKRAPGEAHIEIYAVKDYVEVEQQGAFEAIPPGQTLIWTVTWRLKQIPAEISREPGSASLVSFVKNAAS